jgi:hypothetical protein
MSRRKWEDNIKTDLRKTVLEGVDYEPGSSGSIVSGYELGDRAIKVRSPAEAEGFFL